MAENIEIKVDPGPAESGLKRIRTSLSLTNKAAGNTTNVFNTFNNRTERGLNKVSKAAKGVGGSLLSLRNIIAGAGFGVMARQIIQTVDGYQLLQGRLRLVTSSSEELLVINEELLALSQRTRTPLANTAELYSRIARNADALNASQADILQITESVGQTFQISGASATEAASGVLQFGQALQSGVLQGDELRSIRENAPRLFNAILVGVQKVNPELGVTSANFKKMAADGVITSRVIKDALLSQADAIKKEFADIPRTVGQAFTQLQNELFVSVGTADSSPIIDAIDSLTEKVKDPQFQRALISTAENILTVVGAMAQIVSKSVEAAQGLGVFFAKIQTNAGSFEKLFLATAALNPVTAGFAISRLGQLGTTPDEDDGIIIPNKPADRSKVDLNKRPRTAAEDAAKLLREQQAADAKSTKKKTIRATEAERLVKSMTQELALVGDLTRAEEVRISLANGFYGVVTQGQAAQLQSLADQLTQQDMLEESLKEQIKLEEERLAKAKGFYDAVKTPEEEHTERVEAATRAYREGVIGLDIYARSLALYRDQLEEATKETDKATGAMATFAEQAARNMQDAFADFFFDPFGSSLDDFVANFEKAMRRVAANAAAQELGAMLFGGGGGGGGSGILDSIIRTGINIFGGGAPSATGVVGGNIPLGSGGFTPSALGGRRSAGQDLLVGEDGPERIRMPRDGVVEPLKTSAQSKETVNVYNTFQVSTPNGVISPASQRQLASQTGRSVQEALRRST